MWAALPVVAVFLHLSLQLNHLKADDSTLQVGLLKQPFDIQSVDHIRENLTDHLFCTTAADHLQPFRTAGDRLPGDQFIVPGKADLIADVGHPLLACQLDAELIDVYFKDR